MSTRILIILVVIIILLAVLAMVLGANRKDAKSEQSDVKSGKTGMAPFLDRAFGWMSPSFDLADLTISGATLDKEKRTVSLTVDQEVTFKVKARPKDGPNDCRNLTLVLLTPKATGHTPEVLRLVSATLVPPLPKDVKAPQGDKQFLPIPPPDEEPEAKIDTPKKFGECAIPVFRGGGIIVLTATRACTLEIR